MDSKHFWDRHGDQNVEYVVELYDMTMNQLYQHFAERYDSENKEKAAKWVEATVSRYFDQAVDDLIKGLSRD